MCGATTIDWSASIRQVQAVEEAADKLKAAVKVLDGINNDSVKEAFYSDDEETAQRREKVRARLGAEIDAIERAADRLKTTVKEGMEGSMRRFEDAATSYTPAS